MGLISLFPLVLQLESDFNCSHHTLPNNNQSFIIPGQSPKLDQKRHIGGEIAKIDTVF